MKGMINGIIFSASLDYMIYRGEATHKTLCKREIGHANNSPKYFYKLEE